MFYTVYILYSTTFQKYYTGYTGDELTNRLQKHNSNHKGYTGNAKDWEVVYSKEYVDKSQAIIVEKKIKKRGAKRYLVDIDNRLSG